MQYEFNKPQSTSFTDEQRLKIKELFLNYEYNKMRKFYRIQNYDLKLRPKTIIRLILSCMRTEDMFNSFLFMSYMNKNTMEMLDLDPELQKTIPYKRDSERMQLIKRINDIDHIEQIQWFRWTDFDFTTPKYIRRPDGSIIYNYPAKIWDPLSDEYKQKNVGKEKQYDSSFRSTFKISDYDYNQLGKYMKQQGKLNKSDSKVQIFEEYAEREHRFSELDKINAGKIKYYIRKKHIYELEFQEQLFGLYRLFYGDPKKYSVNKRKKQFILIVTFVMFDINEKKMNEKLCAFYSIFDDQFKFQMITQDMKYLNQQLYLSQYRNPHNMAVYSKTIGLLDAFALEYPGFQKLFDFQQKYILCLFKVKQLDKCIDFIIKFNVSKLPQEVVMSYNKRNEAFLLKEFWFPLLKRCGAKQLSYLMDQIQRVISNSSYQDGILKFCETVYNLVEGQSTQSEVLVKISEISRCQVDNTDHLRFNMKAIAINPKNIQAYIYITDYYIGKKLFAEYLDSMQDFCDFDNRSNYLMETIDHKLAFIRCAELQRAFKLYRECSHEHIHKAIKQITESVKKAYSFIPNSIQDRKLSYLQCLNQLETANLQQILFCIYYHKEVAPQLIYKNKFSHYDLFID